MSHIEIDVVVHAPLVAGHEFRYPWAERAASKLALRTILAEHPGDCLEPIRWYDETLEPSVTLIDIRDTIDSRYRLAHYRVWTPLECDC